LDKDNTGAFDERPREAVAREAEPEWSFGRRAPPEFEYLIRIAFYPSTLSGAIFACRSRSLNALTSFSLSSFHRSRTRVSC
jgi:hypothetical protein